MLNAIIFISLLLNGICSALETQNSTEAIGNLYFVGYIVPNITLTKNMLELGTGNQFGPVIAVSTKVKLPNMGQMTVTMKRCFSIYDNPFFELVEVDPSLDSLVSPGVSVPGYLGYVVDDVKKAGKTLENAAFIQVARAQDYSFAYYRGINGVLIKLVISELVPARGGINIPQAPINLGPVKHVDLAILQFEACKTQLSNALSITWQPDFISAGTPFLFPEGVFLTNASLVASNTPIEIELEYVLPSLGIFNCSDSVPVFHVSYSAKNGTMNAVNSQMLAAGYILNTSVTIPPYGLILTFYIAPDKSWVEVVDERFDI
jgi:hypothetical protein